VARRHHSKFGVTPDTDDPWRKAAAAGFYAINQPAVRERNTGRSLQSKFVGVMASLFMDLI
jgi:hypothetical protein